MSDEEEKIDSFASNFMTESKKRSFVKSGRTKAVTSGHSSSNSIYMDLNQFDDASDISVDDMQFMYSEMGDPDDFNREGLFIDDS